ncbi:hypothetical protein [Flavobacterium sp. UBA6031]|uniref:hypothetical protein n=1 Tax=Flavobacterium sp. UBA6031 TaxID=1946551 RepID=UPI0025C4219F|nr:hypothetical protein [Flavobacterium sp. UBA6031]
MEDIEIQLPKIEDTPIQRMANSIRRDTSTSGNLDYGMNLNMFNTPAEKPRFDGYSSSKQDEVYDTKSDGTKVAKYDNYIPGTDNNKRIAQVQSTSVNRDNSIDLKTNSSNVMSMGTIFLFIGLVSVLLLFKFSKAFNKDVRQIKREGGLENMYSHLINTLKTEYGMSVVNRTNTSVTLSINGKGVYVKFHILKAFNDLNIIWTMRNLVGSHSLKWKFNIDESQQYMLNSIALSIDNFNEKYYNDLKANSPFV